MVIVFVCVCVRAHACGCTGVFEKLMTKIRLTVRLKRFLLPHFPTCPHVEKTIRGLNHGTKEVTKGEKGQNRNRKSLHEAQEMCILSPKGNVSTVVGLYLIDE